MRRLTAALFTATLLAAGSALAAGPELPELSDRQIERYKELSSKASAALQDGNPRKAAGLYQRASRIHGGSDGLFYNLACALALQDKTAEALDALERSRENGWSDANWPKNDGDLSSLHDTLGFEVWTARVARAGSASAWPVPDSDSLATDAEAIEEQGDAWSEKLRKLRGVLGSAESSAASREIAAWKAASWDRVAALSDDEDERAEAGHAAIAAIAGADATRLSATAAGEVLRRSEQWIDEFAGHELAGGIRLTAAEATHAQRMRSDDETVKETAMERFESDLMMLAATAPPGDGLEGALVRLIGFNADDLDRATLLYNRLIDSAEDADAARTKMRSGYSTRGIAYKIGGLPAFEGTTTDGVKVDNANLPGRITLIDFWATWCGPCRAELPNLKAAYEAYHDQGFDILGISLDREAQKDQQAFLAWCEENGMPWPQIYDGKGWSARLSDEFGVRSIPFALLVDENGRVIAADNELRGEKLGETIAEALSPGAAAVGAQ